MNTIGRVALGVGAAVAGIGIAAAIASRMQDSTTLGADDWSSTPDAGSVASFAGEVAWDTAKREMRNAERQRQWEAIQQAQNNAAAASARAVRAESLLEDFNHDAPANGVIDLSSRVATVPTGLEDARRALAGDETRRFVDLGGRVELHSIADALAPVDLNGDSKVTYTELVDAGAIDETVERTWQR